MLGKVRAHSKGFPTFVALIGLFAGVDPPVLTEDRTLAEGLPTHMADIGLLTSMYSLMLEEMRAPTKAFSTLDAHIRSLSTRSHLVSSKWYSRI